MSFNICSLTFACLYIFYTCTSMFFLFLFVRIRIFCSFTEITFCKFLAGFTSVVIATYHRNQPIVVAILVYLIITLNKITEFPNFQSDRTLCPYFISDTLNKLLYKDHPQTGGTISSRSVYLNDRAINTVVGGFSTEPINHISSLCISRVVLQSGVIHRIVSRHNAFLGCRARRGAVSRLVFFKY